MQDPRWRGPKGGGNADLPAHDAKYPSRWLPADNGALSGFGDESEAAEDVLQYTDDRGAARRARKMARGDSDGSGGSSGLKWKVVDYVRVPRCRPAVS